MTQFPNIIDNSRVKLLDAITKISGDFDTLSIATGYWDLEASKLLMDHVKTYKKIRIIIGQEPLIARYNLNKTEPDFPDKDIFEDLQRLKPSSELYETVKELKRKIENAEIEVKIYKGNFLHSKCYIFGDYQTENAIGIIGSSNFTKNGLTTNLELNAGESDNRIVQFQPQTVTQENGHLSWYEQIWNSPECEDWTGGFIELVNSSNHGDLLFSPYEMYIKTLTHIYADELEEQKEIIQLEGKNLQAFQERNIFQLQKRLNKYGVAMLADSVGLGKTITAIGVIKQYQKQRVVIIAPASLVPQWKDELAQEGLYNFRVLSLQNMTEIEEEQKIDKYAQVTLFVIDEAHNLRNHSSTRFQKLYSWIKDNEDAQTLLLTATPINNSLSDLTNQILLGTGGEQDKLAVYTKNSSGIIQLRSFYEAVENLKKQINQNKAKGNDTTEILKEARMTIEPIIRAFVVRNTRQGIQKEFGGVDIDGEMKQFPMVKVKNISFDIDSIKIKTEELTDNLSQISAHSIDQIAQFTDTLLHPKRQMQDIKEQNSSESIIELLYKTILSLSFVPYRYDMYHTKVYSKVTQDVVPKLDLEFKKSLVRQISLYGILRTVFLKRLESSSSALLSSLSKYQRRLNLFEDILLSSNKVISLSDIDDIEDEYLEDDGEQIDWNEDKLQKIITEKAKDVSHKTHNIEAIKQDLEYEKQIIADAIMIVKTLELGDPKLKRFVDQVRDIRTQNPTRKILVFSFFADTVRYLQQKLNEDDYGFNSTNSAFVSGKNKKEALAAAERFAPIAKRADHIKKEDELTYLFATDVLAEGQNLQDCGMIINYDLHWNPVRMIQRNGRINRLGSPHSEVKVINMKPHEHLDKYLKLFQSLSDKIEIINNTIGNDASVLGEIANPLDYTGIYDSDDQRATDQYAKLEMDSESFTDDEFVNDLKAFYKDATDKEKNRIKYLPTAKWGQIIYEDKTISLVQATFDNDQKSFVFLNSDKNDVLDVMMTGKALKTIKSDDKTCKTATNPIDILAYNQGITTDAKALIKFDTKKTNKLRPSQEKVSELALSVHGWSPIDVSKLNSYFGTRNVVESKNLSTIVRKINDCAKKNEPHDKHFEQLRKMLPLESPKPPKVKSVSIHLNFLNQNLWNK